MALVRLIDDRATHLVAAERWRPIRARRLAREAAHAAGDHRLCEKRHGCEHVTQHKAAS